MDIQILGTFINSEAEREAPEDITPQMFKEQLASLVDGDELVLHMNSCGGSVYAGIAIANMVKELARHGIGTRCVVEGICASIASVVACACDKIQMYGSSFFMMHKCWSVVQGNSEDLRREAAVMDQMNKAILSFYKSKFSLTDQQLEQMMAEETWIQGNEAGEYKLDAEVVDGHELQLAAKFDPRKFNKLPSIIKDMMMDKKDEEQKTVEQAIEKIEEDVEQLKQEIQQPEEQKPEDGCEEEQEQKGEEEQEQPEQEKPEEPEQTEQPDEEKPDEELVPKKEVDKRVSGMQAKMQLQINDFKNQLMMKDEELSKAKAQLISLNEVIDKCKAELSEATSALAEKENALAQLNASVNKPSMPNAKDWRKLRGQEFFDWLETNKDKINKQ